MNRRLAALAFAGLFLAQALPSVAVAVRQTATLHEGRPLLLAAGPRDPRDLFRGEYSVLAYQVGQPAGLPADPALADRGCDLARSGTCPTRQGGRAYVVLESDAAGIHRPVRVAAAPPPQGGPFLSGKIAYATLTARGRQPAGGREGPNEPCAHEACLTGTISYGIETWYGEQGRPARLDALPRDALTVRVRADAEGVPVLDELIVRGEVVSRTARLWGR